MEQKRKELAIKIAVLALACVLISVAGRILTGNRFEMSIPMQRDEISATEDIEVSWENDNAMTVAELKVGEKGDLIIALHPEEPGDYEMSVKRGDGSSLFFDKLHVDRVGTTYSMQTRNFTGDNAVIGGVTLFFLGLAVICLLHFKRLSGPLIYSYDAIWAFGVEIFSSVAGLYFLNTFIRRIVQADVAWMRYVYESFSLSGWIFMMVTAPAVLVFSVLMIISNIALLRLRSVAVDAECERLGDAGASLLYFEQRVLHGVYLFRVHSDRLCRERDQGSQACAGAG